LREDLSRIAAIGDESTARAAELLGAALEAAFTRRLQEALGEAALELSTQMPQAHVEVRMAGADPELVYVEDATLLDAGEEGLSARITLRLPDGLKRRLEAAATAAGVSLNTWLVKALARASESRSTYGGAHRLTGYGQG
jgi:hypothetical protein